MTTTQSSFWDGFDFEFVGHGANAEGVGPGKGRLYLDVGNALAPGVIDHHQLAAYSGSAASLVLTHPELVVESVDPERPDDQDLTLVLHREPDLDSLCSAYLAIAFLKEGEFPRGADILARYVDQVDAGYMGMAQDNPFSLYSAYYVLAHRMGLRVWNDEDDKWRLCVHEGLTLVQYVLAQLASGDASILDIDAFSCPGLFGPRDRRDVTDDLERYRQKLADPVTNARIVRLRLPGHLGGTQNVPALLVRNVQSSGDLDRCLFFKDWARTDRERSPEGRGFVGLSVYEHETDVSPRQCIISVTPDSRVSLRGLGELLEKAESEERKRLNGIDDRTVDSRGNKRPPREGYSNPDPWYDGRSKSYTIVAGPREGTLLSAETIEDILIQFGRGEEVQEPPVVSRGDLRDNFELNEDNVRRLSLLASEWKREQSHSLEFETREVFISYPHTKKQWVRENVYEALVAWLGREKLFFDEVSIRSGDGWLARLGEAVSKCQVFLPIYCGDYFRSDFCEWELQLAVVRDPIGKHGVLTPFAIGGERFALPSYCSLIQYDAPPLKKLEARLRQVLAPRIQRG